MPITTTQAITEDEFHHATYSQGSKGSECQRVRRNGQTKTWKTRPDVFSIPVKWGFRDAFRITQLEKDEWNVASECPRCATRDDAEASPR
jgi:hypothetical protein